MDTTAEAETETDSANPLEADMAWDDILETGREMYDAHQSFEAGIPAESLAIMDSFSSLSGSVGRDVDWTKGYDMGPMFPRTKMYVLPNAPPGVDPCFFGEGNYMWLNPEQQHCLAQTVFEKLEPPRVFRNDETQAADTPGGRHPRQRNPRQQQKPRRQNPRLQNRK